MKKIKYSLLLGFGALLLNTGCSDFLDPRNKEMGDQNADTYFSNHPEEIRPVAYDAIRYIATHIELLDQAGDLYTNPRSADDGTYSMFRTTPDDGKVKDYYSKVYGAINKANAMIHYAGDKNPDLVAEGKFLRVLGYYYLTQQFGSVPYSENYINTPDRYYPKVSLDTIYAKLLSDCDDLYNNSSLKAQDHNGYASKQAVAAIAAKVALAAAWDLGTDPIASDADAIAGNYTVNASGKQRFELAASWAEKAINGIPLTMSFEDKWSPKNEGNAEEIFSAQWDKDGYPGDKTSGGHSLMNNYTAYYSNTVQTGQKGTGSGGTDMMSAKAASLFEKGDTRFEGTFMTVYYNSPIDPATKNALWGTEGYMAWYNCTPEEQLAKPIAMKFYGPETTKQEAEKDIRQLVANGQAKKFEANTYGVNLPFAAIVTGNEVTVWEFNEKGTMPTSTTVKYDEFCKGSANNGVCVKKYDDPRADAVTGKQDYRDVPLLHVSEMYLVAAEAYLMAGEKAKSLQFINAVRKRAGVKELASFEAYEALIPYFTTTSFTYKDIDLILDERARECYAERTRYFDLRRTKQLVRYNIEFSRFMNDISKMKGPDGNVKWYRPIPQDEINNNTALSAESQNPGY